MKYISLILSAVVVVALTVSCGSKQPLQERAPAQFGQAYTTSDATSIQLHLPVRTIQNNRVSLDSVYFRGRAAALHQDSSRPGTYTASFNTGRPDLIMSSDPKEEYKNKMPRTAPTTSFDEKEDEAILVFTQNNKTKYYKLTGIEERRRN